MAQNAVLQWRDGRGWLIFAGGAADHAEIRALALNRVAADGAVAYIAFGDMMGADNLLTELEDLGAPSGYLVDVMTEDDDTIHDKLADAGMVIVGAGDDPEFIRSTLMGAAIAGIQDAYVQGAVVLVEGLSTMVFGAWMMLNTGELTYGLEWLEHALLIPALTSLSDSAMARGVLDQVPTAIAVGIGPGSALVLGPDGEVETWGQQQVTIALGSEYRSE
jgi:hypothetical protein